MYALPITDILPVCRPTTAPEAVQTPWLDLLGLHIELEDGERVANLVRGDEQRLAAGGVLGRDYGGGFGSGVILVGVDVGLEGHARS